MILVSIKSKQIDIILQAKQKKKNPSNRSKPSKSILSRTIESILHYCVLQWVHKLPYDLHGTCVYLFPKRLTVVIASHVGMKADIFENAVVRRTHRTFTAGKMRRIFFFFWSNCCLPTTSQKTYHLDNAR